MTGAELRKILKSCFNEDTHILTLVVEQIPSQPIKNLLSAYFDKNLILNNVSGSDLEKDPIEITKASMYEFLNIKNPAVTALFYTDNGTAHIKLTISNQCSYRLSDSYSSLKDLPCDLFSYENPSFILDSRIEENENKQLQKYYAGYLYPEDLEKEVIRGLHLRGNFQLPSALNWLKNYVPAETFELNGDLDMLRGTPRFSISSGWFKAVELGHFSLAFRMQIISVFLSLYEDGHNDDLTIHPKTLYRLVSNLKFKIKDKQEISLPIHADFYGKSPNFVFLIAETKELSKWALDGFASLLNIQSPDGYIPNVFHKLVGSVYLERLMLTASVSNIKLHSISAGFALDDSSLITLIPGFMAVRKLSAIFDIDFGDSISVGLRISGQAALIDAGGAIEVGFKVSTGEVSFYAELLENEVIDITNLPLISGIPFEDIGIKKLECRRLSFSGSFDNKPNSDEMVDLSALAMEFSFYSSLSSKINILSATVEQLYIKFDYIDSAISYFELGGLLSYENICNIAVRGRYDKNRSWRFEGAFNVDKNNPIDLLDLLPGGRILPKEILDTKLISGSVAIDLGGKSLEFVLETDSILNLNPLGSISCTKLKLYVGLGSESESLNWRIEINGRLQLLDILNYSFNETDTFDTIEIDSNLLDISGVLCLGKTGDILSMSFAPDAGLTKISIPLPIPYEENNKVHMSKAELQINKFNLSNENGWKISADMELVFIKIPDIVKKVLHDRINATIAIEQKGSLVLCIKQGVKIELPFVLPEIEGLKRVDLGNACVEISNFRIEASTKGIGISVDVMLYLPDKINNVFGENVRIFKTYADNECLSFTFSADYFDGAFSGGFSLAKLPLMFIQDNIDGWIISLGKDDKYGKIIIDKPRFKFKATQFAFVASGGFKIDKLGIPLGLVKFILENAGLKEAAELLPEAIQFKELTLMKGDKLNKDALKSFLGKSFDEVVDMLDSVFNRLPKEFRQYLNIQCPDSLKFSISITMDGGIDIFVEAEPELKLLLLNPPHMTGIRLKHLSFGEILGGQLFVLRLNTIIDNFDLPTLAIALCMPNDMHQYIGNPVNYRNQLIIEDLVTYIFYQAGIPIPVPVFFERFGIDYYGLGGFGLTSSYGVPEPKIDIGEIIEGFSDFVKFITHKDSKLPITDEKKFDLKLKIYPNYVQTGPMLGDKKYGLQDAITISAYKIIAGFLNGVKFFDPIEYVKAVDIKYRVSEFSTKFLCFEVSGKWLIATPYEFINQKLYDRLSGEESSKNLLSILPAKGDKPITQNTPGIVTFLSGKTKIFNSSLFVDVGLILIDASQFGMGFSIKGSVSNFMGIDLRAILVFDKKMDKQKPDIDFKFSGVLKLTLVGLNVIDSKGDIYYRNENDKPLLKLRGQFDILNKNSIFYISSFVDGIFSENRIEFAGKGEIRFLIFQGEARIDVFSHMLKASLNILGNSVEFEFRENNKRIEMKSNINTWGGNLALYMLFDANSKTVLEASIRSNSIANLFDLSLIYRNTRSMEHQADMVLKLLGADIFRGSGKTQLKDNAFTVNAYADLIQFKHSDSWIDFGFSLSGRIEGNFEENGFELEGKVSLSVHLNPIGQPKIDIKTDAYLTINQDKMVAKWTGVILYFRMHQNTLYIYGFPFLDKVCVFTKSPYWDYSPPFPTEFGEIYDGSFPNMVMLFTHINLMTLDELRTVQDASTEVETFFDRDISTMYIIQKDTNNLGKAEHSVYIKRRTAGDDFFIELKNHIEQFFLENGIKTTLDISEAEAFCTFNNMTVDGVDIRIILPHEENPVFQDFEISIKDYLYIGLEHLFQDYTNSEKS